MLVQCSNRSIAIVSNACNVMAMDGNITHLDLGERAATERQHLQLDWSVVVFDFFQFLLLFQNSFTTAFSIASSFVGIIPQINAPLALW